MQHAPNTFNPLYIDLLLQKCFTQCGKPYESGNAENVIEQLTAYLKNLATPVDQIRITHNYVAKELMGKLIRRALLAPKTPLKLDTNYINELACFALQLDTTQNAYQHFLEQQYLTPFNACIITPKKNRTWAQQLAIATPGANLLYRHFYYDSNIEAIDLLKMAEAASEWTDRAPIILFFSSELINVITQNRQNSTLWYNLINSLTQRFQCHPIFITNDTTTTWSRFLENSTIRFYNIRPSKTSQDVKHIAQQLKSVLFNNNSIINPTAVSTASFSLPMVYYSTELPQAQTPGNTLLCGNLTKTQEHLCFQGLDTTLTIPLPFKAYNLIRSNWGGQSYWLSITFINASTKAEQTAYLSILHTDHSGRTRHNASKILEKLYK